MPEGFLWGTILTGCFSIAGLTLGILLGRRGSAATPAHSEAEKLEPVLAGLRNFTEGFARDVSEYRALIETAASRADANQSTGGSPVWQQISSANDHLQRRLEEAEATLAAQSSELSRYMTEARTDPLTGLPNRRAFDEELSRRTALRDRNAVGFAIVVIDLDHFKSYNDRFGHETGDLVLKHTAGVLKSAIRSEDLVARCGGEEFAVAVTASTIEEAQLAAERIRTAVEKATLTQGGTIHRVTISLGAALSMPEEANAQTLARADAALYAAKKAGRNRVYRHDGVNCRPANTDGRTANATPESFREICGELRKKLLEAPR